MSNDIKRELEEIEIPKELHARAKLGIRQVKHKRRKRYPKWLIGVAASLMILGATFTIGNSYIADADGTLIGKIFGSGEQLQKNHPNVKEYVPRMERHLELAKKVLSKEEFEDYSQLTKEDVEIDTEIVAENRRFPNKEEMKKLDRIQSKIEGYEERIRKLTTHTLEEAQKMVNYPINRPAFIPKGYELEEETATTGEEHIGEDPVVEIQYRESEGEFGFYTIIGKIGKTEKNWTKHFDKIDSYQLNGYDFDYGSYVDSNIHEMRVTIPEQGYEIIMSADLLSKEVMEKVLLSMIEEK
ncbi:hypothetical protein [Virgibacillus pantothenticus]|uniref:hypothetical protein n=1 Tax=Virgibacillus pantothenticus TaxID=1473 RepID=UPI0009843EE2|nr:hypothetical protein [Virgibacillus pantothenticus]